MRLALYSVFAVSFFAALTLAVSPNSYAAQTIKKTDVSKAELQLNSLQDQLVSLANKLRKSENYLNKLRIKQTSLDKDITDAQTRLEEKRIEINVLLQSLMRLSRMPPEAVVAMPGELRHTLQTAQLMRDITEKLKAKANSLSNTLLKLENDELELAEVREKAKQERNQLIASQKALDSKLGTRRKIYQSLNKDYEAQRKRAAEAKAKAKDLQQLVEKLQVTEIKKEKSQKAPHLPVKTKPKSNPSYSNLVFSKHRGSMILPVAGSLFRKFGDKEGRNQTSKGLHLKTINNATVTSPANAEVMFTGPFLDYGNIIILKFDRGYHLLLSGIDEIDCVVGQKVRSGEPIGKAQSKANNQTKIYLELRRNGKPIDPAPWFS